MTDAEIVALLRENNLSHNRAAVTIYRGFARERRMNVCDLMNMVVDVMQRAGSSAELPLLRLLVEAT